MKYLQIYPDEIKALTERLDDAERGRLFMAMIAYAETGEEPNLPGNENFVWPQARLHLDKQREAYSEKVAGAERAREAREQAKKEEQKGKSCSQEKNSGSRKKNLESELETLKSSEEQEQEHKQEQKDIFIPPLSPQGELTPEQKDTRDVFCAWEKAKGKLATKAESDILLDLLGEYGRESLLKAISASVNADAVKLNYIRAVLKGRGKARSPAPRPEEDHILDGIL